MKNAPHSTPELYGNQHRTHQTTNSITMPDIRILQSLETQLNHRLEKLWRVFSWSSSILTTMTAGIIALRKTSKIELTFAEELIISAVIIIFTLYAWLMIKENLKFETRIRDAIDNLMNEELNYPEFKKLRPDKAVFGYALVVLLLGIAALLALWVDNFLKATAA